MLYYVLVQSCLLTNSKPCLKPVEVGAVAIRIFQVRNVVREVETRTTWMMGDIFRM